MLKRGTVSPENQVAPLDLPSEEDAHSINNKDKITQDIAVVNKTFSTFYALYWEFCINKG